MLFPAAGGRSHLCQVVGGDPDVVKSGASEDLAGIAILVGPKKWPKVDAQELRPAN